MSTKLEYVPLGRPTVDQPLADRPGFGASVALTAVAPSDGVKPVPAAAIDTLVIESPVTV